MVSIITGAIGLSVAAIIFFLVRKDKLHVNHALGWIFVAILCALLGFAPGIIDRIAGQLGIAYPPVLALIIGIGLLTIKALSMDIERSRMEARTQRLIQRVAMLEADLNALQGDHSVSSDKHQNTLSGSSGHEEEK